MTETRAYAVAEEFTQAFIYEWEKLLALRTIADPFWRNAEMPKIVATRMWHFLNNDLCVRMTWKLATRRMAEYKWPATWQDAFKERWFPEWAKRRWPVIYRRVDIRELYACKRPPEDDRIKYSITERLDDVPDL